MIEKTVAELQPGDSIAGFTIAIIETYQSIAGGERVAITYTSGKRVVYDNARFFVDEPIEAEAENIVSAWEDKL